MIIPDFEHPTDAARKKHFFMVVDVETSVYENPKLGELDKRWVSMPWEQGAGGARPEPIMIGHMRVQTMDPFTWPMRHGEVFTSHMWGACKIEGGTIVGHNLKFDAAHLPAIREYNTWDTMIAEYILTSQRSKFASLQSLVEKYLVARSKPDLIGANLAKGIRPQDMDKNELRLYLENDLAVTADVFKCQWALATQAQRALIMVQSNASLVYGEMEANGLPIDTAEVIRQRDLADTKEANALKNIEALWALSVGVECAADMAKSGDLVSPTAMSAFFFDVPQEFTVHVPLTDAEKVGLPKSRKLRKRLVAHDPGGIRRGVVDAAAVGSHGRAASTKSAILATNDDVFDAILAQPDLTPHHEAMIQLVREARGASKVSGTYMQPWLKAIEETGDHCLHPKINTVLTDTGRTSSSKPNAQNIPPEARKCVTTEFEGGTLLEADFKQLEVCGLAQVSQCQELIAALCRGDDIHYLSGQKVFGWTSPADMNKEQRRIVKTINFGLIYGGSAPSLAKQARVEEGLAKDLIRGFYCQFPGVQSWQNQTQERVNTAPDYVTVEPSSAGTTEVHHVVTETGRGYAFNMEPPPAWASARAGGTAPFRAMPTKVKNYPVQGFATGDIVPLAVVLIRNMLREKYPDVKPRLVVHDSILLDVPSTVDTAQLMADMQIVAASVLPAALAELWGIDMQVPLALDFNSSPTWNPR